MKKQREDILRSNYLNNEELIANRYAIKSVTSAMAIITIIWILTMIKVFLVDETVTTVCFISCAVVYVLGILVCKMNDMSKRWIKYFILLWVVVIITIISTGLTFHATLACLLPIVYTSIYSSRKMMIYTYILTVFSIIFSVFVGYQFGICDANMLLLPGEPTSVYIDPAGNFTRTQINDRVVWSLSLFFVLPRCMVCAAFSLVCSNVSKIININVTRAETMKNLAEKDGMTGLYNKSKYMDLVKNDYCNEDRVAVIFWDINYLKKVNDTVGHEAGDRLILAVADGIKSICNESDFGFRVGGDEFVMIMRNADEKDLVKKVQAWEHYVRKYSQDDVSVALGYAHGRGQDVEKIIGEADKLMYENKRMIHRKDGAILN